MTNKKTDSLADMAGVNANTRHDNGQPSQPGAARLYEDGAPAFPIPGIAQGMTLRDYMAAAALQGILIGNPRMLPDLVNCDMAATCAYRYADSMLRARKQ